MSQQTNKNFVPDEKEIFKVLNAVDVNGHTESKNGLTYLSWAWAWGELKKIFPDAIYTIERFGEEKRPYLFDKELGYMVFTTVTIMGLTHEMWLPVMDNNNKSMTDHDYTYTTRSGERTVAKATMFDINKTIMRCLVKNISMFGLGLYIYAGEDLPEDTKEQNALMSVIVQTKKLRAEMDKLGIDYMDKNNELILSKAIVPTQDLDKLESVELERLNKVYASIIQSFKRQKGAKS